MNTLRSNLLRLLALGLVAASFPVLALAATAQTPVNANLYERNPNNLQGSKAELSGILTLSEQVGIGYLVMMEKGDPANVDDRVQQSNWSDVVNIGKGNLPNNGAGLSDQIQMISDPHAFPTYDEVISGGSNQYVFLAEVKSGTGNDDTDDTVFNAGGGNTYHFHSDAAACEGVSDVDPSPTPTNLEAKAFVSASPSPGCIVASPSPSPTGAASPAATAVPALPKAGSVSVGSSASVKTNPLRLPLLIVALALSVAVVVFGGRRYLVRR